MFTSRARYPTRGRIVSPTIKMTANGTWNELRDKTDFECAAVVDGEESIEEGGERLFRELIAVLNGKLTRSEILGHREFSVARAGLAL